MQSKILVLGVGNILLKDDGVGPLVVQQLARDYNNPHVTFLDGGTLGLDLLGYLEGYDHLLIIDALDLAKEPGQIFCWEGKMLSGLTDNVSFHQVGVKELLHAINFMDLQLHLSVMGVQIADISWGMQLSDEVEEAIPNLKNAVINQIEKISN